MIDWLIAGLFDFTWRCGCFGRWCLPSCAAEHWRFSYHVGLLRMLDFVDVHASFRIGMNLLQAFRLFHGFVIWLTLTFFVLWYTQQKRVALMMVTTLFQGASIGPLIAWLFKLIQGILPLHLATLFCLKQVVITAWHIIDSWMNKCILSLHFI